MDSRLEGYVNGGGHEDIAGSTGEFTLRRIIEYNEIQAKLGIKGNLVEIGVFHGKVLVLFGLLAGPSEFCLALDVFDDHRKNYDLTGGAATLRRVKDNFARIVEDSDKLRVLSEDSLVVRAEQIRDILGPSGVRIFSIDGAHSHFHTAHDMMLATQVCTAGAVIIVDDITNAGWPGVMEGVARYFLLNPDIKLFPFLMTQNKLWLTTYDYHHQYFEHALQQIPVGERQRKRVTRFFGHDIVGF